MCFLKWSSGFSIAGQESKVLRLRKALYGLKQAPRAWNKKIDGFMMKIDFDKCSCALGVYVRSKSVGNIIIVCLYVDDLLITRGNEGEIAELKRELMSEFEMTDIGSYPMSLDLNSRRRRVVC